MKTDSVQSSQSTTDGSYFDFAISIIILTLMAIIRSSVALLKHHNDSVGGNGNQMNLNRIIQLQRNARRYSVIMTIIGVCLTYYSLDSSIGFLYRWLSSLLIAFTIETLMDVMAMVYIHDVRVRETAARILENHRNFLRFAYVLLFISVGLAFL